MRAIDVRELLEHPGTSRAVHVEEPIEGIGTELAGVPAERPVEGDLVLEGVSEGVYVHGSVAAPVRLRCARCLKEFDERVDVSVAELVPREAGPEDDYAIADDLTIDPEPLVRDAVSLELPFAPLCSPTCAGLCPRCGADRNLEACSCPDAVDPRWAALEGFTERMDRPDDEDQG
ncbi:MAG: YceD family protein [Actinomycetota bacterium]